MQKITDRQQAVLDYLKSYIAEFKYPPTILEIACNFGIFTYGIRKHLKSLADKRFIKITPRTARGIKIL